MNYVHSMINSPVGKLTLVASDSGLAALLWENDSPDRVQISLGSWGRTHPILVEASNQIEEYFAGVRRKFTVKLDFVGTDFQKKVWSSLQRIPYGEVCSYGEMARQIGNPKGSRAVGAANARNPISIFAPCHRVVGSSGELTGFAGGLVAKRRLLELEGLSITDGYVRNR